MVEPVRLGLWNATSPKIKCRPATWQGSKHDEMETTNVEHNHEYKDVCI